LLVLYSVKIAIWQVKKCCFAQVSHPFQCIGALCE